MAHHSVVIDTVLNPSAITIVEGDRIVWTNSSAQVQSASSDDGGVTFATGPIQPGADSLPIAFDDPTASLPYSCPSGLHGTIAVLVSFERTIKPFFTEIDRNAMMDATHTFGVITFDLWSHDDCRANWDAIRDSIASGRMPPSGPDSDGPWPQAQIDRFVSLFDAWKNGGFQP